MRDRYFPCTTRRRWGYLTLDKSNLITQANRAAAKDARSHAGRARLPPFTSGLDVASRSTFYAVASAVRRDEERHSFDALLPLSGGRPAWVELTLAAEPGNGELRITMTDVTNSAPRSGR